MESTRSGLSRPTAEQSRSPHERSEMRDSPDIAAHAAHPGYLLSRAYRMSFGQVIRRADRQPLGSDEEVKAKLDEAFPGMRYARVDRPPPLPLPRWSLRSSLVRLVLWFNRPRYPYWSSHFEGDQFIAEFHFDFGSAVREIRVTLYGRGTAAAKPHFAKL